MVEVHCTCGTRLRLGDEWAGQQGACPKCGAVLNIPALERVAVPAAAARVMAPVATAVKAAPHTVTRPATSLPPKAAPVAAMPAVPASAATNELVIERPSIYGKSPLLWIAVSAALGVVTLGVLVGAIVAVMWRDVDVAVVVPNTQPEVPPKAVTAVVEPPRTEVNSTPPRPLVTVDNAPLEAPVPPTTRVAIPTPVETAALPPASAATDATEVVAQPTPRVGASKSPKPGGLTGVSRQYDDFECRRIQQEFGLRIPAAATILEVNGERLPIANVGEMQKSAAPYLFLPAGTNVVRWRTGDGLLDVKREKEFVVVYSEMRQFFHRNGKVLDAELFSRGARALDVHGAPFLLNLMGASYVANNQMDAAERKFRRALRINPAFSPAHLNLARCLSKAGRKAEAIREVQLADAFNVGNVFGLTPAIVQLRRELGVPIEQREPVDFSADVYISLEATSVEDERLEALLQAISKYAVREEERGKIRNNLAVHFADSGRPELALEHFRSALDALKYAGPERFELARQVFSHMHSACRKAGFAEAEEYSRMQNAVMP